MTSSPQWINALSLRPSLEAAIADVCATLQSQFIGEPDLAIAFLSSSFASDAARFLPLLQEKWDIPNLIGCIGGGIVGMVSPVQAQEIEQSVALSLTVAKLPGTPLRSLYLAPEDLPDLDAPPQAWIDYVGIDPQTQPDFILLIDPMASGINDLLAGLDYAYPQATKVGGLASSGNGLIQDSLFLQSPTQRSGRYGGGTVALAMSGATRLGSIVAQGCRPIGDPFQVIQGERNIILQVQGSDPRTGSPREDTPLQLLRDLLPTLSEGDQALAQHSLFVGIANDEFKMTLQPGDFLIRNLLGVDPRQGAIAIGDRVRLGQRLQFHLRDAQTSADDLQLLLQRYHQDTPFSSPAIGALMFSCLGRGANLYDQANFDSTLFHGHFPHIPLGGFFCNGEIGQVGAQTFLHGYTSVFAVVHGTELSEAV